MTVQSSFLSSRQIHNRIKCPMILRQLLQHFDSIPLKLLVLIKHLLQHLTRLVSQRIGDDLWECVISALTAQHAVGVTHVLLDVENDVQEAFGVSDRVVHERYT